MIDDLFVYLLFPGVLITGRVTDDVILVVDSCPVLGMPDDDHCNIVC